MSNALDDLRDSDGRIDARALRATADGDRITATDCYRLRVALLHGVETGEHAAGAHYARASAHYHATGKCRHEHSVPPLRHTTGEHGGEWVIDE